MNKRKLILWSPFRGGLMKNFVQRFKSIASHIMAWAIIRIYYLFFILYRGKVYGLENLVDSPVMFVSNHTSYADWLVLYSLFKWRYGKQISFIAKKRLFESKIWGPVVRYAKAIYVDQERPTKSLLKSVKGCIRRGEFIGVFPEGTRSETGKLIKGENGAVKIALKENLPIIPIGLKNFHKFLPRNKAIPRFVKCSINIGPPVILPKDAKNNIDEATRKVMQSIATLTDQAYIY